MVHKNNENILTYGWMPMLSDTETKTLAHAFIEYIEIHIAYNDQVERNLFEESLKSIKSAIDVKNKIH